MSNIRKKKRMGRPPVGCNSGARSDTAAMGYQNKPTLFLA
jgi:hypothetical protein